MPLNTLPRSFDIHDIGKIADDLFPFRNDADEPTYNDGQRKCIVETVDAIANNDYEHVIIEAPTGVGKSIIARMIHMTLRKMHGDKTWRTTITCPTKGLQDQYVREDSTIANLKGKKNYQCLVNSKISYGHSKCIEALRSGKCKENQCPYFKARSKWLKFAQLRVTNTMLGILLPVDKMIEDSAFSQLQILDECHEVPNRILDCSEVKFDAMRAYKLRDKGMIRGNDICDKINHLMRVLKEYPLATIVNVDEEIREACEDVVVIADDIIKTFQVLSKKKKLNANQKRSLDDIQSYLNAMVRHCNVITNPKLQDVIIQERTMDQVEVAGQMVDGHHMHSIVMKPLLPRDMVEEAVYDKHDHFVHMSATICGVDKYAETMGIDKYFKVEIGNPIPIENRRITYLPVGRMSGKHLDSTKPKMLEAIDELIEEHIDDNGLIHTGSYKLAEYIKNFSKYKDRVHIGRDRKVTMAWLEHGAQEGNDPVVVVSPSMTTGYDLKGDLCRFMICAKIPFGYLGEPLIKYRADNDSGSYGRETILDVVQGAGRGVRGIDDYSAYYMLDESFDTLMKRNQKYFPQWFLDAIDAE